VNEKMGASIRFIRLHESGETSTETTHTIASIDGANGRKLLPAATNRNHDDERARAAGNGLAYRIATSGKVDRIVKHRPKLLEINEISTREEIYHIIFAEARNG